MKIQFIMRGNSIENLPPRSKRDGLQGMANTSAALTQVKRHPERS